jgi:hypothetical protein
MASDMEVRMKQKSVTEFLLAEKMAPIDIQQRLLNVYGDQTVDVSRVRRWVVSFSSGDRDVSDRPRSGRPCTSVSPEIRSASISSSARIGGLRILNCVRRWMSALMRCKRCWQRWNIAKFVLGGSDECSHRNIKTIECKSVRTCWTTTKLKMIDSWTVASPVTRRGYTTTTRNQNDSPWSGDMRNPQPRKVQGSTISR